MNPGTISTLFRTELRMVLRDRRMVLTSLVLPLLVTPLLLVVSSSTARNRERLLHHMVCRYAVAGTHTQAVRSLLSETRRLLVEGTSQPTASKQPPFRFEEVRCADPRAALDKGQVQLVIEGFTAVRQGTRAGAEPSGLNNHGGEAPAARADPKDAPEDDGEAPLPGALELRLVFRADRDTSGNAMSRMRDALSKTRAWQRANLLRAKGFTLHPADVARISEHDLATRSQVAGLALGRVLTLVFLFLVLVAGAVIATDSLAGEKERGTLETLLTTGASRIEILLAKHLVIQAVALLITFIQAGNLLVYVGLKLLPLPGNVAAALPLPVVVLVFFLLLPVAVLAANSLLLISGYARSYKEAQMYFMPALLLGLLPGLVPFLPGVSLRSALVLVPVANIALGIKEVMVGRFDWPLLGLSWILTSGLAAWTLKSGARLLSTERLITATQVDAVEFGGGRRLFERRVVVWFAVMWAALLSASNYLQKADVRLQVAVNLVGILFTGCCLMLWHYRLDPRAVLALRAPRGPVWLGVLFAVPGGLLTAQGLVRLTSVLFPVPEKALAQFDRSLLPAGIPLMLLLPWLTVAPGIFEEIAFRGVLLHGLHRRLRPVPLALIVGVVFGLFHMTLFRLVPTACLGMMLAGVTLLTGSIFPAMVWHASNNALGILVYQLQLPATDLDPVCYAAGGGMLAVAFWIFWRCRTPYPGLRCNSGRQDQQATEH